MVAKHDKHKDQRPDADKHKAAHCKTINGITH